MAKPVIHVWPIPDHQGICLLQSTSGAANLLLNGNITINTQTPGRAVFQGITRTVSLTSTNNLSGRNFTITGLLNGSQISETRAGPNNNTVETTAIFDEVLSVHVNGAAAAVSIGSGTTGRTHWSNYDYNLIYNFINYQVVVGGTINFTINTTCDDVATNPNPFLSATTANQTTNYFGFGFFESFIYSAVFINSSGADGTLTETYMQQGIV